MQPEEDPDARWVADLTGRSLRTAEARLRDAADETRLFAHLARMHRQGGRPSYVEIDAPLELYAIARILRPRHTLEVGVSSGVSSAYLLQALERNGSGTLHSIDRPKNEPKRRGRSGSLSASWAVPPGRSSGWAVPPLLRGRWDLRIGDKKDLLPLFAEELDRVDLMVYDVPHEDRQAAREFGMLDPRLRQGGVAIADHGPAGGLCSALDQWAHRRGAEPRGRQRLGLYGFRASRPPPSSRRRPN
jgi:hypothetical protein